MLTRHDIINDDLSAFMDIPRQMGRSGAESIDDLFFTLLLKNTPAFFSGANSNLLTGADTAFGPDSLTDAKTTFRKQKAGPGGKPKDQKPINIRPEYLVVPVELETEAELLMGSAQLMIDAQGSPTKIPVDNPHRNKYRIISHAASVGHVLHRRERQGLVSVRQSECAAGIRDRVPQRSSHAGDRASRNAAEHARHGFPQSYIDFGVNSQDHRAAVKVTGEA